MKLVSGAVLVLAAAVAFTGGVLLTRDSGTKTVTVAAPRPSVSPDARILAATDGIDPVAAQERIRTARATCDVLREVGDKNMWRLCTFNVTNGDPWYETMPPRQIRAVSDDLITANR